jgi:hypothetical protein
VWLPVKFVRIVAVDINHPDLLMHPFVARFDR